MADLKIPENVVEAAARVLRYEESSGLCKLDHPCLLCDCNAKLSDEYARLHARKVLEAGFEEMGLRRTSKTVLDHTSYHRDKDHVRSAVDALRDVLDLIAEEEQETTTVDIAELVERIEGNFS